jgi:hypothetical protein
LTLLPKAELGVVRREGRVVVQDLDRLGDPPLVLTGSAEEIWQLLDGRSVEEVVAALVAVHAVEADVIRPDVEAFLDDLRARDIVRPV